jgi:hypothetical protein
MNDMWGMPLDVPSRGDRGRSVAITPALRADDARKQAAGLRSTAAEEWRAKLQLDAANLRTAPARPATALRQGDDRPVVLDEAARGKRGDRTVRDVKARRRCEGGCGGRLNRQTQGTLCRKCRYDGFASARAAKPGRVKCSKDGCDRLLRQGRVEGFCYRHTDYVVETPERRQQRASTARKGYAKKMERVDKRCACGRRVRWDSKSGICKGCTAMRRRCRTVLSADSLEEYRLDRAWAGLSLADKDAVLSGALKWCSGSGADGERGRHGFDDGLVFPVEGFVG